jgi:hypothetical protein
MNTGQFNEFIARLDEMVVLLQEIANDVAPKQKPPKRRTKAKTTPSRPTNVKVTPKDATSGKNAVTRRKTGS